MPRLLLTLSSLVIASGQQSIFQNHNLNIRWTASQVVYAESVQEVVGTVQSAVASGRRVKALGSLWSWNTNIASRGNDIYVRMAGDLASAHEAVIDTSVSPPTVTVGAGALVYDLYERLAAAGLELASHGACMSSWSSQCVGGVLATNVHHSGIPSFYHTAQWIDVVTSTGLIRAHDGDELFRLTVGGGGRTGVIVRAQFRLIPRSVWRVGPPAVSFFGPYQGFSSSVRTWMAQFDNRQPGELISGLGWGYGIGAPNTTVTLLINSERLNDTEASAIRAAGLVRDVLPANFGVRDGAVEWARMVTRILDPIAPDWLFNHWWANNMFGRLAGPPPPPPTGYASLDVAVSNGAWPNLEHLEFEFSAPVTIAHQVADFIERRLLHSNDFPTFRHEGAWMMRYGFGAGSYAAGDGILSDGTSPNVVWFNSDCFRHSNYPQFEEQFTRFMGELSAAFPRMIRHHPGKMNPPLYPSPESDAVGARFASFDPSGTFARDPYDPTFYTFPLSNSSNAQLTAGSTIDVLRRIFQLEVLNADDYNVSAIIGAAVGGLIVGWLITYRLMRRSASAFVSRAETTSRAEAKTQMTA